MGGDSRPVEIVDVSWSPTNEPPLTSSPQFFSIEAAHVAAERRAFMAAKLFRVDGILCDEQTRLLLLEHFSMGFSAAESDRRRHLELEILQRKYGCVVVT